MRPKIGTKVYCIYGDGILAEEVGFLGSESFIIKDYGGSTYEDSWEWYYDDYERSWFTDLDRAKAELIALYRHKYKGKLKIVHTDYDPNWYQLEEYDEEEIKEETSGVEEYNMAIEDFVKASEKLLTDLILQHKEQLSFASGLAVANRMLDEVAEKLRK